MSDPKKPVETLRDGSVKSAVWENEGQNGTFHAATFSRSYRDENGNYAETNSFSGTDLLKLSRLSEQTYEAIQQREQVQRHERAEQQQEPEIEPPSQNYAVEQREASQAERTPVQEIDR